MIFLLHQKFFIKLFTVSYYLKDDTSLVYAQGLFENTRFFYNQHFYKQCQVETGNIYIYIYIYNM